MTRKITAFILILSAISMDSCKTDFSLNGEYEVHPVVFGLLDHRDDFHTIKVTKAFLGDGDNLQYAQNPDSNYFEQVDARIIEYIDNSETGRTWQLFDTILTNKSTDGLFYAPEQKVYAFFEPNLDSTAEYELIVDINNGEYEVTGRTELLEGFNVSSTILFPSFKVPFAPHTVDEDSDYSFWQFTVTEANLAARYNYKYTLKWTETYSDLSTASFEMTRNNNDVVKDKPSNPLTHQALFQGVDFYQWVASIVPDDPNVIERRMTGLDLKISVAHEDLEQYMQVSQPVTGVAQVQPEYTNLSGGRGLFSSRLIFELKNLKLNSTSMKELCVGLYTGGKLFCSDYDEHIGESFYCP
ncbi:MAG: hypothetical protein WDZ35_03360 [Crocinitomicaceae bacterium]